MARIAVAGFMHETNCFVPGTTDFNYFAEHRDRPPLCRGDEIFDWLPKAGMSLSGFLNAIGTEHDLVPLAWTSGGAGAIVSGDAFERCAGEIIGALSKAMPIDAIYLDLHGACTTEDFEDGESELLRRVRASIGNAVPIIVSHDYHANVTPETADYCDALCGYLTYPHIDRPKTGARAARALETILVRGMPTAKVIRKIPFLIPLTFQCTMVEPSKSIIKAAEISESSHKDILTLSYLAGFPPSDQYWCGPSVVCHGYNQNAVDEAASGVAEKIEKLEPAFAEEELLPDAAVKKAMALAKTAEKPVVIADTQDNPGAGGTCDTTGMLAALVKHDAGGAVLGVLSDPSAAEAAHEAGENSQLVIELGGKGGIPEDHPFKGTFTVAKLGDGKVHCTGPYQGGRVMNLGKMALLRIDGVSVVVASKRVQAGDKEIFRHLGIEPENQKILVLKSTVHFRADFQPIAQKVLVALAPGSHISDPRLYPYTKLRPGIRLVPLGPEYQPADG